MNTSPQSVTAAGIILPLLGSVSVGLRFYARSYRRLALQADDWLALAAAVSPSRLSDNDLLIVFADPSMGIGSCCYPRYARQYSDLDLSWLYLTLSPGASEKGILGWNTPPPLFRLSDRDTFTLMVSRFQRYERASADYQTAFDHL